MSSSGATVIGAGPLQLRRAESITTGVSSSSADPPQYLGVPVTPEIETEVGVQAGFASGAVINWSPENGAELAND